MDIEFTKLLASLYGCFELHMSGKIIRCQGDEPSFHEVANAIQEVGVVASYGEGAMGKLNIASGAAVFAGHCPTLGTKVIIRHRAISLGNLRCIDSQTGKK
jgi:hypothetical protein